jgi:hypothetical protein
MISKKTLVSANNLTDFASPITGVPGRLIHLLRPQKLRQHSLITSLTHRQRQFFAVQLNYLSTPTALHRQTVSWREFLFISQGVINL